MNKPLTPEASATWTRMCKNHDDFERLCLDLLAHPEATPEQVLSVRADLIAHRASMRETHVVVKARTNRLRTTVAMPAFMVKR